MAIEITGLPTSQLHNAADGPSAARTGNQHEQRPQSAQQETATVVDTVSFTETATQLQAIERAIADLPVVDNARVSMLQHLIERGDYEIDADHVADRLMIFEGQI